MVQVLCMHHNGCNWLTSLFHDLQAAISIPTGPQDSYVYQQDLKLWGQRDLDHGSLTQGPSRHWGARAFLSSSATQQVFGIPCRY